MLRPTLSCLQNKTHKVAESFTRAFIANSMKQTEAPFVEDVLSRKAVVLEYNREKRPKAKKKSKGGKKALSAGEKRSLKVFDLKPEHQRLVQ